MKNVLIILLLIILFYNTSMYSAEASGKHKYSEAAYQYVWCKAHNGIEEYENSDKTRVDCLTKTHAVEFDFANKWAESIGQALHYSYMTGKKGKVVLILENPNKEMCYYYRVQRLGYIHNFDVEYITTDYINSGQYEKNRCY